MPAPIVPSRRQRAIDSDDEDASSDSDSISNISTSSSTKRLRRSHDAKTNGIDGPVLPASYRSDQTTSNALVHQPGSIVRIECTNFVTYTHIYFNIGPSLNMIIGPNGNGKSTLVCAICLGLGWGPQPLGRAKNVSEFVKHGQKEAEIKIELAAGPAQNGRNPVIRRTIQRDGNRTTWHINGRLAKHSDVQNLVKSFSIQIDNLCQFLPQDRVVEFAALSPVQLLDQTQRAAAPQRMIDCHEELKELGMKVQQTQSESNIASERLTSLEKRQESQRPEYERIRDRQEHQDRVDMLERFRPRVQWLALAEKWKKQKERLRAAQNEFKDLEHEQGPALEDLNAKKEYAKTAETAVRKRQKFVERFDQRATEKVKRMDQLTQTIADCDRQLVKERDSLKEKKGEAARLEQNIRRLKRQHEEEPVEVNTAEYNEKVRDKTRQIRDIRATRGNEEEAHAERTRLVSLKKEQFDRLSARQRDLKTQAGQQVQKLQQLSRDSAKAWEWVQENKNRFEAEVYGPPIVECTVPDPRYAGLIETVLQRTDFLSFTCTTKADFKLLQDQLYGEMGLRDITIRSAVPLDRWKPPVPRDSLGQFSLDGYLIDHIKGPDAVLSFLCDTTRLHRTGVTLKEHNDAQFEKLTLRESPINAWITGKQHIRVIRRPEYGDDAVSTNVRAAKTARIWGDQIADHSANQEIEEGIAELRRWFTESQEMQKKFKADQERWTQDLEKLEQEKRDLETEKGERQKAYSQWQQIPSKIEMLDAKLEGLKEKDQDTKARHAELVKKRCSSFLDKGQLTLDYANDVEMLRQCHFNLVEAQLQSIEAKSDIAFLEDRNKAVTDMLEARRQEITDLKKEKEDIRQEIDRKRADYHRAAAEITEEESQTHDEMSQQEGMDEDKLNEEIMTLRAQIGLLHEGNPDLVRQFEERATEIDRYRGKVSNFAQKLEGTKQDILALREEWEPQLDALIKRISDAFAYNFSKIGCAGEVGIFKDDEDFKEWAIQIRVKFREHEQLSILDNHRQSGGERAVSTIFYLMALQSLARSPFRVVDEINQGMDPRNERMVHERMVDIACSEHTSQYFLVTPKLLRGLKYHPRMAVHTIVSGEHMPQDPQSLDFQAMADRALEVRSRA